MLSGYEVLGSIDHALQQALRESEVIDREVSHLTERLLKLRDDETRTYAELARLRLNPPDGGQFLGKLSTADQQLKALIEQRRMAAENIELELNGRRARLTILQMERDRSHAVAEERFAQAQAEEDRVRAELEKNDSYTRQRQLAEQATQTARFATQKAGLADKDRLIKGKPYEDDPLFMYLWELGYGTREYRANPLSRALDAMVARHAGYQASRPNYAMLQEIPKRLTEHAAQLREIADSEMQKVMQFEECALGSGQSGQRRNALDRARAESDKLEDELEALEAEISQLLERKNILARGEDESTKTAFKYLEDALRRTNVGELWEAALGTPFEEDDVAVRRLEFIHSELSKVQGALENQKSIQVDHQSRLRELEKIRREYRRGGYGRDAWDFRSSEMLSVLLGEMLRGAMTREVFWENMRRHQRPMSGSFDSMGGGLLRWPEDSDGRFSGGSSDFGDSDFRSGGGF